MSLVTWSGLGVHWWSGMQLDTGKPLRWTLQYQPSSFWLHHTWNTILLWVDSFRGMHALIHCICYMRLAILKMWFKSWMDYLYSVLYKKKLWIWTCSIMFWDLKFHGQNMFKEWDFISKIIQFLNNTSIFMVAMKRSILRTKIFTLILENLLFYSISIFSLLGLVFWLLLLSL